MLALASIRHAADGEDAHPGRSCNAFHERFDRGRRVRRWAGIGHGTDGREPAAQGRFCLSGDGALLLEAWLAKMRVKVDEPRRYDAAAHIDVSRQLVVELFAELHNDAIPDMHVQDLVQ